MRTFGTMRENEFVRHVKKALSFLPVYPDSNAVDIEDYLCWLVNTPELHADILSPWDVAYRYANSRPRLWTHAQIMVPEGL